MDLSIMPMTEDDVPQVISLMREFAEYEHLSEYCTITGDRMSTAMFGTGRVADGLCAFDGDRAVGYAIFYPNFSTFRGQRGLYLEDIYVDQKYRGKRIGEAMLRQIARIADERGFERIDFMVLEWNEPAVKFYEKLGAVRDTEERHFKFTDDAFRSLI